MALYRLLDQLPQSSALLSVLGVSILVLWSLQSYLSLRKIPGPFLAAISDLPRVSWITSSRAHDIQIDLHKKDGKLVRFGPNMVSVRDPAEIPNLYGFTGKIPKV